MALILPPEDLEKLNAAICRAFNGTDGHVQLNEFAKRTVNIDIYLDLGGRDTPIRQFAGELIEAVTRNGTTETLLRELFVERKGDGELRELALRLLPDADTLVPLRDHQEALLASAQGGVGALDGLRGNPAVQARLNEAAVDLREVSSNLDLLAAYKSLHDVLHNVQMRFYRQIAEETARLATDPDSALNLAIHAADLATLGAMAVETAAAIAEPMVAAPEKKWTAGLMALADQLEGGAESADLAAVRMALSDLKRLLRLQPARLNNLLAQTARRIPVVKLVETMRVAAASLVQADPKRQALADAGDALEALMRDIHIRIDEHEAWQAVENSFWLAEDALQHDDQDSVDELNTLWLMLIRDIEAIRQMAAGEWADDLQRHASACTIPAAPPVPPESRRAFQRYVHRGRIQFFSVDSALKSRCTDVAKLSTPLRQLIEG